jgi:hypothetical protein
VDLPGNGEFIKLDPERAKEQLAIPLHIRTIVSDIE